MLLSSTPFLSIAAIAASLTLTPLVSAEIYYGATGVEYAKRFTPSSGVCFYVCPQIVVTGVDPNTNVAISTQMDAASANGVDDGTTTTCTYSNTDTTDGYDAFDTQCLYGSVDGDLTSQTGATTFTCMASASTNIEGCMNVVSRRRTLSKLERRVRDRQFNPRKVRESQ